jgi:hypothetical protein
MKKDRKTSFYSKSGAFSSTRLRGAVMHAPIAFLHGLRMSAFARSRLPQGSLCKCGRQRIGLMLVLNEAINGLQIASPDISWTDVQNVLIAAYCRVVVRKSGITVTEKWNRMRQFEAILERQIAANMMPAGNADHRKCPSPTRRLPGAEKAGGSLEPDGGPINDSHSDARCREIAVVLRLNSAAVSQRGA